MELNEDEKKQEELLNTIKMEPIIEKTEIKEEDKVTQKKKIMKLTDYLLIALIVLLVIVFAYVVIKYN